MSKVRYLAGACIYKGIKFLRSDVMNKLHCKGKKSKVDRKMISEEEATLSTRFKDGLHEIEYMQVDGKHLFHVSDDVFKFFMSLNEKVKITIYK